MNLFASPASRPPKRKCFFQGENLVSAVSRMDEGHFKPKQAYKKLRVGRHTRASSREHGPTRRAEMRESRVRNGAK